MTSKEALKKLEDFTNWSSDEDIEEGLYNRWGNVACRAIKKDLEILDKYRNLVREYASIQGRNLKISIEEMVSDFRELENDR